MEIHHHEHPHSVESGEGNEKKPVLKKVKEKVKKIKNTISKKRHGHGEDEHGHYNDISEEEDDEYEEEEEPEVHGAPMYESAATKNLVGGRDENAMGMPINAVPKSRVGSDESRPTYPLAAEPTAYEKQNLLGLGTTAAPKDSIRAPAGTATQSQASNPSTVYESEARRNLVGGLQDESMVSLGGAMGMPVEDPAVPKNTSRYDDDDESRLLYPFSAETAASEKQGKGQKEVRFGATDGSLEEDPGAPKGSSVAPAVATQLSHASSPSTGVDAVGESPLLSSFQAMAVSDKPKAERDPLDTPPTGTHDQFSPEKPQLEKTDEEPSSYTDKITSTAAAAKDAAVSAAVGSTEYGKKIASTVYDKVSGAGTAIMGKGTAEPNVEVEETKPAQPDKGVSWKEKLRPGDEDRALAEVISDATHTNKQQVSGTHEPAKGPSSEGSGGKGMVDKIKGAVSSWIGAGGIGGPRASPTTDTSMQGGTTTTGTTRGEDAVKM